MMLRKYLLPIITITTIGLLAGCAETPPNSVKKTKTESTSRVEHELGILPLSKALPQYEIWYRFPSNELTKDSIPKQLIYFDGKNVESYFLKDFTDEFVSIEDYEELSISQLLDMEKNEQLEYARKFTNGMIETAIYSEWWSGSGVDKEQKIDAISEKAITDYQLNIITDGSGNNSSAEEFYTVSNFLVEDGGNIKWELSKKVGHTLVPASINRIPIYNHFLSGYIMYSNNKENLFLTNIGNDNVSFTLDTPQDKSANITIDEKVE